jgi:hypothetical protein
MEYGGLLIDYIANKFTYYWGCSVCMITQKNYIHKKLCLINNHSFDTKKTYM